MCFHLVLNLLMLFLEHARDKNSKDTECMSVKKQFLLGITLRNACGGGEIAQWLSHCVEMGPNFGSQPPYEAGHNCL